MRFMKQSIILIGPRCVGKTYTGEYLAKLLKFKFIDSDYLLERKNKTTISQIVSNKGWRYFRELEQKNIKYIINNYKSNVVLALGGGAIAHEFDKIRNENLRLLKKYGKIIFLFPSKDVNKSAKILFKRIKKDNKSKMQRPNLTNLSPSKEMLQVIKKRLKFYKKGSHQIIYTKQYSEMEVAKLIIKKFLK